MKVRLFLKMRIKQILEPQVSRICFLHYGKVRREMDMESKGELVRYFIRIIWTTSTYID